MSVHLKTQGSGINFFNFVHYIVRPLWRARDAANLLMQVRTHQSTVACLLSKQFLKML